MSRGDFVEDMPANPALRRVVEDNGGPDLVDLLADRMSGADLTTLLLEVFRRRAHRRSPVEVMRSYRADRFVSPAATDFGALRRAEDALLSALPGGFEVLTLAPLLPLAAHSAVATVDPRKVIATIRGSEVAADPTNALALEASLRRSRAMAGPEPRASEPVRLAASQRVVRAQHFGNPGMSAHFQLFALVTAGRNSGGRNSGGRSFEDRHLAEHLRFAAEALAAAGVRRTRIRLTCLRETAAALVEQVRGELAGLPGVDVLEDPGRTSGRGYYTELCFKIYAGEADRPFEVGDGGFVDWSRRLTGSRRERLLITGLGVERVVEAVTSAEE
jgi:hypothetical protein